MKNLLTLAFVAGSIALSACTTVEQPTPRTTTTTTEEHVVHTPVVGASTTQVTTGATVY